MDAHEFWRRYCEPHAEMTEAQEQAIDMFLEAMGEILWQMEGNAARGERHTVRAGIVAFLEEAEGRDIRGGRQPQFEHRHFSIDYEDLKARTRGVSQRRFREMQDRIRRGDIRVPVEPFGPIYDEFKDWKPDEKLYDDLMRLNKDARPRPRADQEQHNFGNTLVWFQKDPPLTFFRNEETGEVVEVSDMQIRMVWDEVFTDGRLAQGLTGEEQVQMVIRRMKQQRIIPWA